MIFFEKINNFINNIENDQGQFASFCVSFLFVIVGFVLAISLFILLIHSGDLFFLIMPLIVFGPPVFFILKQLYIMGKKSND